MIKQIKAPKLRIHHHDVFCSLWKWFCLFKIHNDVLFFIYKLLFFIIFESVCVCACVGDNECVYVCSHMCENMWGSCLSHMCVSVELRNWLSCLSWFLFKLYIEVESSILNPVLTEAACLSCLLQGFPASPSAFWDYGRTTMHAGQLLGAIIWTPTFMIMQQRHYDLHYLLRTLEILSFWLYV